MNDDLSISCRVCSSDNYHYLFHAKNSDIKNNTNFFRKNSRKFK